MIKSLFRITGGVVAGFALFLVAFAVISDGDSHANSNGSLVVTIDRDEIPRYRELASELGLEYGRDYSTDEWWFEGLEPFQFRIPEIGDCGTWAEPKECEQRPGYGGLETLYCSHGRNAVNRCETQGESPFLETVYLTEHDVTLLAQMRREDPYTYVTLLKLAEGRHPDLHEN